MKRRVALGDVTLSVSDVGDGDPVVLIPGLGYASWCWWRLVPLLTGSCRTIAVDPRGTGESEKPSGPYRMSQLADDIAMLIGALDLAPAHVVGHSMGGYVAQTLAVQSPEVVRSLVLMSTSPGGPEAEPVPRETLSAWEAAIDLSPEAYARATFSYSFRPDWASMHPEAYEADLAERLRYPTPPERWHDQFVACRGFLETGVDLDVLDVPTLVIHGDADRVVPVSNAQLLASKIAGSHVEILEGAGHNVMLEDAEMVAAWMQALLS